MKDLVLAFSGSLISMLIPANPTSVAGFFIIVLQVMFFAIGTALFFTERKNKNVIHELDLKERELKRKALEAEIAYFELKKEKLK